ASSGIASPAEPKLWEDHRYLAATYHKSGSWLLYKLTHQIFESLGAADKDFGFVSLNSSQNLDAPILYMEGVYSAKVAELERRASGAKGIRAAGCVRDPLAMIASAYCYHHRGEELSNPEMDPEDKVPSMGPNEGTAYMALQMLSSIQNMVEAFKSPQPEDTHLVRFETISRSSKDFDHEVEKLLDFWLPGLAPEHRELARAAASLADLNRYPTEDVAHTNSPDCEALALAAAERMPGALLSQYRSFQRRLGYR
ncbi:NSUN2, partial [Symbiodinium pilosum]